MGRVSGDGGRMLICQHCGAEVDPADPANLHPIPEAKRPEDLMTPMGMVCPICGTPVRFAYPSWHRPAPD